MVQGTCEFTVIETPGASASGVFVCGLLAPVAIPTACISSNEKLSAESLSACLSQICTLRSLSITPQRVFCRLGVLCRFDRHRSEWPITDGSLCAITSPFLRRKFAGFDRRDHFPWLDLVLTMLKVQGARLAVHLPVMVQQAHGKRAEKQIHRCGVALRPIQLLSWRIWHHVG